MRKIFPGFLLPRTRVNTYRTDLTQLALEAQPPGWTSADLQTCEHQSTCFLFNATTFWRDLCSVMCNIWDFQEQDNHTMAAGSSTKADGCGSGREVRFNRRQEKKSWPRFMALPFREKQPCREELPLLHLLRLLTHPTLKKCCWLTETCTGLWFYSIIHLTLCKGQVFWGKGTQSL